MAVDVVRMTTVCAAVHILSEHGRTAEVLIAYDWWNPGKFPIWNQAFLFSFVLSTVMSLAPIWYAKRRPKGTPVSWGEAMLASVYVFGVMFLAFGVVPHQYIDYADKNLSWNKSNLIYGPFDLLKPQSRGGGFPFDASYEAVRDTVVVLLHVYYFGLILFLWKVWQGRGDGKPSTAIATSTYGRPLVKKG
jgi:hypothetical protein